MTTKNLLVELFVEELPPKALKKLGEAFATVLADSLKAQGLAAARCGRDALRIAAVVWLCTSLRSRPGCQTKRSRKS